MRHIEKKVETNANSDTEVWYLYVLRCADDSYYTGVTKDPKRRLNEHNSTKRGAKYTRSRRPIKEMVVVQEFTCFGNALRAEREFKKLSRREKTVRLRELSCLF